MTAILTLDQAGLPAGTPNEARDDGLDTGAVMSATASGYNSTFRMELLWSGQHGTPDTTSEASFAPAGPPGVYTWTPTVGAYGTWLIRLVTDEGTPEQDEVVMGFAVKTAPTDLRIPAPQERGDANASFVLDGAAQKKLSWFNKPELTGPFSGAGGSWAPWWRPEADLIHAFNTAAAGVPASRQINTTPPLQGGGDLSADRTLSIDAATTLAAGSMSASDKSKLDGIQANAAAVTSTAPVDVTKAAAVVGVGTTSARHDHKHDVSTAAAVSIGTSNTEGVATSLARSDHGHNHANQAGGSLHALAIAGGAAGFLSGTDKTKLDELAVELVYVTVSGTSKTLALADRQTIQQCTNAAAVTITWPSATFNNGTSIGIDQDGAGQVTVAGSGVTPSGRNGLKTGGQFARLFMDQKTASTIRVTGDTTT